MSSTWRRSKNFLCSLCCARPIINIHLLYGPVIIIIIRNNSFAHVRRLSNFSSSFSHRQLLIQLFGFVFFILEIHGKCLLRDCGYARAIEVSAWWTSRIAIMKVGKVVTFYEPSRWSAVAEASCATCPAVLAKSTFSFRSLRVVDERSLRLQVK